MRVFDEPVCLLTYPNNLVAALKRAREIIAAQAAYIAELDIAIAAQKAELAALKVHKCLACGKELRGMFRASGQGLCANASLVRVPKRGVGRNCLSLGVS